MNKSVARFILLIIVLCMLAGCKFFFPERPTQETVYMGPRVDIDYGEEVIQLSSAELRKSLVEVVEEPENKIRLKLKDSEINPTMRTGSKGIRFDDLLPRYCQ